MKSYLLIVGQTGDCIQTLDKFEEPVTGIAWLPDSATFITGCLGTGKTLKQWDLNGNCVTEIATNGRLEDIALSPNGRYLATIDNKKRLSIFDLVDRDQDYQIVMTTSSSLASIAISRDSKTVLVGFKDGESKLFNMRTKELLNTFIGQEHTDFIIRSAFGGAQDSFITSGSEGMNFRISNGLL